VAAANPHTAYPDRNAFVLFKSFTGQRIGKPGDFTFLIVKTTSGGGLSTLVLGLVGYCSVAEYNRIPRDPETTIRSNSAIPGTVPCTLLFVARKVIEKIRILDDSLRNRYAARPTVARALRNIYVYFRVVSVLNVDIFTRLF